MIEPEKPTGAKSRWIWTRAIDSSSENAGFSNRRQVLIVPIWSGLGRTRDHVARILPSGAQARFGFIVPFFGQFCQNQ
jgi:hypothetical protein